MPSYLVSPHKLDSEHASLERYGLVLGSKHVWQFALSPSKASSPAMQESRFRPAGQRFLTSKGCSDVKLLC